MSRHYEIQDKLFRKAKDMGYRARSVFKLQELQEKFGIVRKNDFVLDVGAAPGSFLQDLSKWVGESGKVTGFDISVIDDLNLKNVRTFVGDLNDLDELRKDLLGHKFDVVISDAAPKTSGQTDVDQYRSIELNGKVLELTQYCLKHKGTLVLKVFMGSDFDDLLAELRQKFAKVRVFKPKAVRPRSKETYVICFEFGGHSRR